jgi:hypothetical protein
VHGNIQPSLRRRARARGEMRSELKKQGCETRRTGLVKDASGTPLGLSPLREEDCTELGGVIGVTGARATRLLMGKVERGEWGRGDTAAVLADASDWRWCWKSEE